MYVQRNITARSLNHRCREKATNIKYYKCVSVALVIHHEKRMCRFILPCVVSLLQPHFPTLSQTRHDFRREKKVTEHKMCCDFLNFFLKHFSF